ncbi:MAG TPA: S8 family serine peptidase, partial [Thermoanaerobaculia bacterium]|nr:S8 family serine peptidase [Thermoanaerobaculia bacterium]
VGELLRQPQVQLAGPVVLLRERSLSYLINELIVRFRAHVTEESVRGIARQHGLEILRAVPYSPNTYHFSSPGPASYELLAVADALARREDVEWAEPNLVTTAELDAVTPTDFLWNGVWDRQLVDTPNAWQHLQDAGLEAFGSPDVIIAAVDQGIESVGGVPAHPDFQGTVSDGSAKVYRLFDFVSLVPDNDSPMGDHGMGVSGVAAARAENPSVLAGQTEGLAGAAPNCRIMGLIFPFAEADIADMYIWAAGFDPHSPRAGFPAPIGPGADIFTTSIGFGAGAPISGLASAMLDFLMTYGRGGKGCLCFFSGGNANNDFTTYRPWAAYEKTFGMAASTLANDGVTEIRAPYSGFGPVELCAPSHDEYVLGLAVHNPPDHYGTWSCQLLGNGKLIGHAATQTTLTAAATTGQTVLTVASVAGFAAGNQLLVGLPGTPGSEPVTVTGAPNPMTNTIPVTALLNNHAIGAAVLTGPANYRNDFGGTSSATPLTAGVAALVLSANPDLTWIEARQILRDTAEKIDAANTHPTGQWLDANGNPSVTSGLPPVYSRWYGFGRVDAERAVDEALGYVFSRDLVVRDNLADVGAVPAGGAFWNSPDLWVRTTDPVVEGAAGLPPNYATAGPHQSPIAGQDNWVYARLRNNGTDPSLDFYVRIYIAHYPGFEFTYPDSFIPTNRPGDPVPSPMTPGTYLIGEVKGTGLAPGADTIVSVRWPEALVPPETVMVGPNTVHWHPCLLLEVAPHDGPAPTGNHVWDDNNLTQKNISIVYTDAGTDFAVGIVAGHRRSREALQILEIDRGTLPRQVRLFVDLVDPRLKERLRQIGDPSGAPDEDDGCRVTFLEETRLLLDCPGEGRGEMVLTVPPQTRLERVLPKASRKDYNFTLGTFQGREVAFLAGRGKTRIPLAAGRGALTPIIVGGVVGNGAPRGVYSVHLIQRDPDGEITGGAELEVNVR